MTATDPASTPATDRAVAEWLRDNAHRLRTLDPASEDFSDLEPLRAIVGDARVVAIGESTHRVHEFYQLRDRLVRFLVTELGFGAVVWESGFPEAVAVNDWVLGGSGDLTHLLHEGITYHMGKCAEMQALLEWLRAYNDNTTHQRKVRFYGLDVPDSSASALPAVTASLALLDEVDPAYAQWVRDRLLPLFDYLPSDRTGLAWAAPALHAYLALDAAVRYELTAHLGALAQRLQAMRVVYADRVGDPDRVELAVRCAASGRQADAFLAGMARDEGRDYEAEVPGANLRDAAMADNVEWILKREERIILAAANGHIQRAPLLAPPFIPQPLTVMGQHLAASLREQMVVIATTFGGGTLWAHRPIPDGAPGHTQVFTQDMGPLDALSLDALLATAGLPRYLLDLRATPTHGPVAERFAHLKGVMIGPQPQLLDPLVAFDAVVFIDAVSPWHTFIPTPA